MSDNDEIVLVSTVEMSSMECETLVEVQSIDGEAGVEEEVSSELLEIDPEAEKMCSEPVVTVESQSSDYSEDEGEDDNDQDEENTEENEEEEEDEHEDEESNEEYEFKDCGDHYRRRRGNRYDRYDRYDRYYDYDPYDDDNYEFICKKCKTDNSYEYVTLPPTTLTEVPSLTLIASVCVAATLWNHVNIPQRLSFINEKCAKNSDQWSTVRNEVLSLPNKLPIPNRVAKQIKNLLSGMATEITDWVSYHFRTIFQKNVLDKEVYNHIYHIVWRSNGAINCEETARSMITSVRLSEVEKFKFLATYCIREEIQELSPLVFMNNAMEYVNFSEYPLIVYWYRYFKNQLHKIAFNSDLSLDAFMFRHDNVDNWPAKEYFFERLSRKKQIREAIWLINKHGITYQTLVLSKLDEDQRLRIFMRIGVKIIMNYIKPPISWNLILSTWHEIRYFINAEKCIQIFRRLLQADVNEMLLTEIWVNTPGELKNYLIYADNYEIVEKILLSWKWCDDSDFIFILLEELHADTKKGIIKEAFFQTFLGNLLWNGEHGRLNRILQCCLPELEETAQFKREITMKTSFTSKCDQLIRWGDYRKLDPVLEFCFPTLEERQQFKANLIRMSSCMNHCEDLLTMCSHEKLNSLLEFYLPNIESRVQFKRELLKKESSMNHCVKLLSQGEYQKLDRILEFSLPELEEKLRFKSNFIKIFCKNHCERLLLQREYLTLDQNLEYCLPGIEEKVQFIKGMTDKSVFETHCEVLLSKMDYEKLNQSLKVYFFNVEEMKRFKHNLVFSSTHVRNTCLIYYSSGSTIQLNNYLMQLLAPYTDLISTFKIKLLKSSEGIRKCIDLFTSPTDVVSLIIEDTLKDSNQATTFKKSLIMSQFAVSKLKKLLIDKGLNVIKSCCDRYLVSGEEKKNLKKLIIGDDVVKQMRIILSNHDETYLQSFMLWCFGTEDAVQKFKQTIPLEFIFIDLLKESTFLQYNRLLTNCRFRNRFEPKVVDRFLNWYFKSPCDRMQFKMKVIRNCTKFEMFNTLLRKSDDSYLKAIVRWFFQNDTVEIAKFKSMYSNYTISKLL